MTHTQYLLCILMSLLGQGLHLFLIKIPALKTRSSAANKPFSMKDFWNCDWNIIVGTQIVIAMATIGIDEILKWKPEIVEYIKWFFAAIGAFGSTVAMALLSKYEKGLMKLLDIKANIADAVTGGTTTVQETIDKGSFQTGVDVSTKPTV